jgi:hypothetical protein
MPTDCKKSDDLLKRTLLWNLQTGHTHGDWDTWSVALVTNFSRQLSFAIWDRLIQDSFQQQTNRKWNIRWINFDYATIHQLL